ncbi:MAG: hypothetical protein AAB405_00665 [Patescibacteria group bacterium]
MNFKNKKIKIFFLFSIFCFLLSTSGVIAAELRYFESFYDTAGNLTLATAGPVYQYFIPYDDYVSGFDIWVENEGSSGAVSFGLRDNNDNLLAAKTITVPYVARTAGGQKLHVAFDQPVNVVSGQIYKIKMISSLAKFKIYYSNTIDVQVHNATNALERQIKPAYVGANEQSFFFKFALYEDGDIALPIISNFSVNVISPDKTSFRFNANEPVDYKISYWPNGGDIQETNFFNDFYPCDAGIRECVLEISTLPNTNYSYRLMVKDAWENETDINGNFTSSPDWTSPQATSTPESTSTPQIPENNSAPIISNISIVSLDDESIKIAWQTNKAAGSSLLVSLDAPGEQAIISVGDSTFELEHVLNSGNVLRASTKYIAKIASIDADGNYVSQNMGFTTLSEVFSPNEPNQGNQDESDQNEEENNQSNQNNQQDNQSALSGGVEQDSQGNYYFNVEWGDNQPAGINGYRIDIFDSNKNLAKRLLISREKRGAAIESLSSGEYYVIVYSDNNGIFEKVAVPEDFEIPIAERKIGRNLVKIKNYLSGTVLYIVLFSFSAIIGIIIFYVIKRKNSRQ